MDDGRPRGVKMQYFPKFIKEFDISCTATTDEVCQDVIKRATKDGDKCFFELIPDEFKGPAQVFLSHAWSRPFTRITDLLLAGRITSRYNSKVFVWFDLFAVHQNGGRKQKEDLDAIQHVIKSCSKTVLILDQPYTIDRPVMLTRMWCLYEMFKTWEYGGDFVIVFDDPFRIKAPFPLLRIEDGKVTKEEDKQMILSEVGNNSAEINAMLNQIMHQIWVIRSTGPVLLWWFLLWNTFSIALMAYGPIVSPIFYSLLGVLFLYNFSCYALILVCLGWNRITQKGFRIGFSFKALSWQEIRFFVAFFAQFIFYIYQLSRFHWKSYDQNTSFWYTVRVGLLLSSPLIYYPARNRKCVFTEVAAIVCTFYIPFLNITNCAIYRGALEWLDFLGLGFDFKIQVIGFIVFLIILYFFSWFGYYRYRKLNHTVKLPSNPGCCWKILWSCLTLGVEPLINPRFVLGMRNPAVGLLEPLVEP